MRTMDQSTTAHPARGVLAAPTGTTTQGFPDPAGTGSLPSAAPPKAEQAALVSLGPPPHLGFDAEYTAKVFQACSSDSSAIPTDLFLAGCKQIRGLIDSLGSAMRIASADIDEKVDIMTARLSEFGPGPGPAPTLQDMVRRELANGTADVNVKGGYISASRSLLRLMWFLDFVTHLVQHLLDEPSDSLRSAAQSAYDAALAPHHPWVLRKSIGVALYATPSRAAFLGNLCGPSIGGEAALLPRMAAFAKHVRTVKEALWTFYRANGITELK